MSSKYSQQIVEVSCANIAAWIAAGLNTVPGTLKMPEQDVIDIDFWGWHQRADKEGICNITIYYEKKEADTITNGKEG